MENKILKARKNRKMIIAAVVIVAAALGIFWFLNGKGKESDKGDNVAYVSSVAQLTGQYASNGVFNRFTGVIEPQATKAFNKRDDGEIAEIFVETGDKVEVGTALFSYDTDKYQEDLSKGEIELERMQNELESIKTTVAQLEKEKKSASSSEKANYTVQIQEQQLNYKQQEYDIQSKELELDKIRDNIAHATVTSDMEGVVKSINKDSGSQPSYGGNSTDSGFIVIMKTGDFRVKGTVNEQNMHNVSEGMNVIVHSRLDDQTWKGVITTVDRENTDSNQNNMYGDSAGSSAYPFYVELDSSEGLLMGQHVYMEIDHGQEEEKTGIWLDEYMIDFTDPDAPFVWADNGKGRLEKRSIKVGDYDDELFKYHVQEGLSLEDSIAFPDESFTEGMKCVPAEMQEPAEEGMQDMDQMEDMGGMEDMGETGDM